MFYVKQGELMNEQLSNTLAEILKASKDGVVNLALFTQQQAPELAKEIIQWGFWNRLCWSILDPVLIITLLIINKHVLELWKISENHDGIAFICIIFWIIGGVTALVLVFHAIDSVETCIKCIVAPKLYLMDYIKDFLTSKGK